jgi:hypothetical protein
MYCGALDWDSIGPTAHSDLCSSTQGDRLAGLGMNSSVEICGCFRCPRDLIAL